MWKVSNAYYLLQIYVQCKKHSKAAKPKHPSRLHNMYAYENKLLWTLIRRSTHRYTRIHYFHKHFYLCAATMLLLLLLQLLLKRCFYTRNELSTTHSSATRQTCVSTCVLVRCSLLFLHFCVRMFFYCCCRYWSLKFNVLRFIVLLMCDMCA